MNRICQILVVATLLVLVAQIPKSQAWNSGKEDKQGPEQARSLLLPWKLTDYSVSRADRNEHGLLMQYAIESVDTSTDLLDIAVDRISLPVYVSNFTAPPDYSMLSVFPKAPLETYGVQYRQLSLAGLAGLADHSFSLWDWASGNETCPVGVSQGDATVAECHKLQSHLGAVNSSHFVPQAGGMYFWYHQLALDGAVQCKNQKELLSKSHLVLSNGEYLDTFFEQCAIYVLALEMFGQHFLQDVWAVGHMWPRWGAPDLREFQLPWQRESALLIAAVSGLIHGCEAFCTIKVAGIEVPFKDRLSSGTRNAFLDFEHFDIPFHGIGDGRVDELLTSPGEYVAQRTRLEDCGRSGLADVWEALGETAAPGKRVQPDGATCLGPRNTHNAIFKGWGLAGDVFVPDEVPSIAAYYTGSLVLPDAVNKQFRKDLATFEMNLKLRAFDEDANVAPESLTPVLDVASNEAVIDDPPAPYADPRTLTDEPNPPIIETFQGKNDDNDDVYSDVVLKRLFNKAHIKTLCSEQENNPTDLRNRVTTLRDSADPAVAVACELCTEFTARHLQFPVGSPSMCEIVGGGGLVINDFAPSAGVALGLSPLQSAAAEWCGCKITGAQIFVRETREENPRFDTRTIYIHSLESPINPPSFFNGVPGSTCGGEVGAPLYSGIVNTESEGEALLYPANLTSFGVVDIYSPGNSSNRKTCSSFVATRNLGRFDEQIWINVAERRATFSPNTDREYQIRYYNGDYGDRQSTKRCEGGWSNVEFGGFAVLDNFECDHSLRYEAVTP